MSLSIFTLQEDDGRWIADVPSLHGVIVYGDTRDSAIGKAKELALLVVEDRMANGESLPSHTGNKSFKVVENNFEKVSPKRLLAGLLKNGWTVKRESDRFKVLSKGGNPDFIFAFTDEEIRVRMLDLVVKSGVRPKDL